MVDRNTSAYRSRRKARLKKLDGRLAAFAEGDPPRLLSKDERELWFLDYDLDNWEPATECNRPDIVAEVGRNPRRWAVVWVRTDAALARHKQLTSQFGLPITQAELKARMERVRQHIQKYPFDQVEPVDPDGEGHGPPPRTDEE